MGRTLTGLHLLLEASRTGLRQTADDHKMGATSVAQAKVVACAALDIPSAALDARLQREAQQCPQWADAVTLVRGRALAHAHEAFHAALLLLNRDLAPFIGFDSAAAWVEYYAAQLLDMDAEKVQV